jgi:hypothetical protein
MIREVLRHGARYTPWFALLVCAGVSACSSPAPTADAYVNANVVGSGATCNFTAAVPFAQIGMATGSAYPTTETSGNGGTNVQCTVSQSGDMFSLNLFATSYTGTLVVTGTASNAAPGAMGSTSLTGTFESTMNGQYQGTNCTLTYTFGSGANAAVPANPPIAPGQIFGHIDCPNAQLNGDPMTVCDASADFLFQNCSK